MGSWTITVLREAIRIQSARREVIAAMELAWHTEEYAIYAERSASAEKLLDEESVLEGIIAWVFASMESGAPARDAIHMALTEMFLFGQDVQRTMDSETPRRLD